MTDRTCLNQGSAPELEIVDLDKQKQRALCILGDLWDQASDDGINIDCLAHAALFQALSSLVLAYGEETVSKFCSDLPNRILCGDYTLDRNLQ
ncbi:hypothetical protein [Cohaesibacter haloalkalitolerans]|jgi:hypothetical protein|uniref:hypothetical protein n=1 Tax=Cohaesibacter haloalkalitolerans TaxID=1162980 RepID=UPI001FE18E1E|nr:hypothetical protein [Cohaesibacter haloalkalitolerans]